MASNQSSNTKKSPAKTARSAAASARSRRKKSSAVANSATPNGASKNSSLTLPVLPLRGLVSFPFMMLPLMVGRDKSVAALEAAHGTESHLILLVAQRDENIEEPAVEDLYRFGTLAEVMQMLKMPDGNVRVVIEGRARVRIESFEESGAFLIATAQPFPESDSDDTDAASKALLRRLKNDFETATNLSRHIPPEALQNAQSRNALGALSDLIVSYLDVDVAARQSVLESLDPRERAEKLSRLMSDELQVLEIEKDLDSQVREGVSESQREFFLRERMKAIQDKLGDRDNSFKEADQLRTRVQEAAMTEEAQEKALAEISRLEKMPSIAPEVSVIRTYVEMLCDLPWNKRSDEIQDLAHAQRVLDEDHWALEKIKERILEFLAVRKLNPQARGPILCFVGPPGVGKTSIGKSIAKATGREFIRVSVGGIHDEAEIRGHRRTYIGSMPGRVISAIRRVKVSNPVFMLDEIDKLGRDFRGDPSSALLEALDPEQNTSFSDHYLEVPFDLSQVLFVATANQLDPIPPALRDRLEVLRFPGYTENEKLAIARHFLVPKQLKENGVSEENVVLESSALTGLIREYSREAGVRNLEREIGTLCRKVARRVAEEGAGHEALGAGNGAKTDASTRNGKKRAKKIEPEVISEKSLATYLGPRKFIHGVAEERDEIGVAQGLAWTEVGGEIMGIEVALSSGKGAVKLTGNLGAVMKESCEAAMTYARVHANELGFSANWTRERDAHIHVPAGAVPKDGPSAGVAIGVALISALSNRKVRREVAMTGEISLRGRVLPVGGVKEKVMAAHRAGLKEVLLPRENERDIEEIPAEVKTDLQFHLVENLSDALAIALHAPTDRKKKVKEKAPSLPRRNGAGARAKID